MFKQFFFALFLGFGITVHVMQQNQWVKEGIGQPILRMIGRAYDCTMSARVKSINFIFPCIEFEDMVVTSKDKLNWVWHAESFVLSFPWLDYVVQRRIFLSVGIHDVIADTNVINGLPSIWKFIDKLRQGLPGGLPITLQALKLNNTIADVHDDEHAITSKLALECDGKRINGLFKTAIFVHNGDCYVNDYCCATALKGSLRLGSEQQDGGWVLGINTRYTVDIPQLVPYQTCVLDASLAGMQGHVSIKNDDPAMGQLLKLTLDKIQGPELLVNMPLHYIGRLLTHDTSSTAVRGNCVAHVVTENVKSEKTFRGNITIENLMYNEQNIAHLGMLSFVGNERAAHGELYFDHKEPWRFSGPWQWNGETKLCSTNLSNADQLTVGNFPWRVDANGLSLMISYGVPKGFELCFAGTMTNSELESTMPYQGSVQFDGKEIKLAGIVDDVTYAAQVHASPLRIAHVEVRNNKQEPLIELHANTTNSDRFDGRVNLAVLRSAARNFLHTELQAEGHLAIQGLIKDKKFFGASSLQGIVRLPNTFQVINSAQAHLIVDPEDKRCIIRDVDCSFNRGSLLCDRATILWNEQYQPYFAHVPLRIKNCFFSNGTKDMFAAMSGMIVGTYRENAPSVTGSLIIEKAQYKKTALLGQGSLNPFGDSNSGGQSSVPDIALDLQLVTKEPIQIKTLLVDMNTKVDMQLKGSLKKPVLTGGVELFSGSLAFPYRPLHITKGSLYFLPGQTSDPLIELVAKNKIKQYQVALNVSGTLQHPHVMLDASPVLTDEQIIALLLVGSEEHSLNAMVPALIMQNVKNFITNPDQSPMNLEAYWAHLLKPLRYIHIMPSFIDQTGRGGLRAALEIEASERFRATVQKNFDLTEDVRADLEYLISDDIKLKGSRDHRGDIAAEVEMRWKF